MRWVSALVIMFSAVVSAQTAVPSDSRGCSALRPALPDSVHVSEALAPAVQRMITSSRTFRRQCRQLADAPALYVRMRVVASLHPSTLRAISVIQRTRAGPLVASIDILDGVDAVEWIAHELEHVIEQVEGVRVQDVCAYHPRLCESVPGAVDTIRAVQAGRAVVGEVQRGSRELTPRTVFAGRRTPGLR